MSKLQKSAWVNLAGATCSLLIAGLAFAFLTKMNARGIVYVLVWLVIPCVFAPATHVWLRRKSLEAGFDEREKMIYKRAFAWSAWVLMVFLAGICIVPFFLLGGQNVVRVYYLPLIFLSTLFVAQFAHSMAILVQCELEDDHG